MTKDSNDWTFGEYVTYARETAIYPKRGELQGLLYAVIGLTGEAGELANKVKKILRDADNHIGEYAKLQIAGELGDILWYVAAVCDELSLSMSWVASYNITKLEKRQEAGKIGGEGDNR